jgi:hypothetical protein
MKKIFSGILFAFSLSATLFAGQPVTGCLLEKATNEPLGQATVQLFNAADSAFVAGTVSNAQGHFTLPDIPAGNYRIAVSFVGLAPVRQIVEVKNAPLHLGNIVMGADENALKEFVVRGVAAQMGIRNDTVEYNAVAFKVTENAVTEDLLKKMPGIEIDAEGRVFVNGEEVKKIRINGKRFFGNSTRMATKNLPADLIDKIQIIDEQSEMAKLTGFADGETVKMINITIREDRKKGLFANLYAGAGADSRYEAGGIANWMSGDDLATFLIGSNNTNNARFDGLGELPVQAPGMKIAQNQPTRGMTDSRMIGMNGSFDLRSNLKLETNYAFGSPDTHTEQHADRETTSNSGSKSRRRNVSTNDRAATSHNAGFRLEWKISPTATLVVDPDFTFGRTRYSAEGLSTTSREAGDTTILQTSRSGYRGQSSRADINVTFSKKFSKKGRTLSFNSRTDIRRNGLTDGLNANTKIAYRNNRPGTNRKDSTIVNQTYTEDTPAASFYFRTSYIEPLTGSRRIELSYAVRQSDNDLERLNYSYDNALGEYNPLPDSTSNEVHSRMTNHRISLNLRNYRKRYNYTVGVTAEPSTMHTEFPLSGEPVDKRVFNIAPSANLTVNFHPKKYLKIDYRATTSQPSATQLRRDTNDTNPSYLRIGNPELKPRFTHTLKATYSAYNRQDFSLLTVNANGSLTRNAIVNRVEYTDDGIQTTQPVNVDGVYNLHGNVLYNKPLFDNRLTINLNTPVAYSNNIGFTKQDGAAREYPKNHIRTWRVGQRLKVMWQNHRMELSGGAEISYVRSRNDVNERQNTRTSDFDCFGALLLRLPLGITLDTDVVASFKKGYSAGFDTHETIWNVVLEKPVFRNRKGIVGLKFYDLLRQRLSMRRTIGENYVEDVRYNTLRDYVLVTFAYKLDFWGNRPAQ